ncbi:MAG: hypothetical protein BWX48_03545 [Verrucomicrobia bacterium ADurb.Bin006]|nr:MAG: hypothetical protein BWX48_03545 [Verrucomicrobia bacterium ADurb.Bin006]
MIWDPDTSPPVHLVVFGLLSPGEGTGPIPDVDSRFRPRAPPRGTNSIPTDILQIAGGPGNIIQKLTQWLVRGIGVLLVESLPPPCQSRARSPRQRGSPECVVEIHQFRTLLHQIRDLPLIVCQAKLTQECRFVRGMPAKPAGSVDHSLDLVGKPGPIGRTQMEMRVGQIEFWVPAIPRGRAPGAG